MASKKKTTKRPEAKVPRCPAKLFVEITQDGFPMAMERSKEDVSAEAGGVVATYALVSPKPRRKKRKAA